MPFIWHQVREGKSSQKYENVFRSGQLRLYELVKKEVHGVGRNWHPILQIEKLTKIMERWLSGYSDATQISVGDLRDIGSSLLASIISIGKASDQGLDPSPRREDFSRLLLTFTFNLPSVDNATLFKETISQLQGLEVPLCAIFWLNTFPRINWIAIGKSLSKQLEIYYETKIGSACSVEPARLAAALLIEYSRDRKWLCVHDMIGLHLLGAFLVDGVSHDSIWTELESADTLLAAYPWPKIESFVCQTPPQETPSSTSSARSHRNSNGDMPPQVRLDRKPTMIYSAEFVICSYSHTRFSPR